jgi:hypothetical protein
MSELGRGRVVVKESREHFIPDLPDFGKKKKNQVGASRMESQRGQKSIPVIVYL